VEVGGFLIMEKPEDIQKKILSLIPTQFRDVVAKSIEHASEYHKTAKRYSGEPLILHLLSTSLLTIENGMDTNSTISAILHEIHLNEESEKYIVKNFGKEVLNILLKIEDIRNCTLSTETPDEVIIKYILGSSKDLRPVIIKILDTLEDMRTIETVPQQECKVALHKALNIYAVLAEYLNLDHIKKDIEENAFREYLVTEYESITKKMQDAGINNSLLEKYKNTLIEITKELPFKKRIEGRIKGKYSIYNKLKKYEKEWIDPNISRVDDLIAFRVITDTDDSCFHILEKLMDHGEPDYDLFDDYISNPKPNGYQAIQFPIKFSEISDLDIEVQILTEDMYYYNTYGPASHIAYKASKSRYAKPTNQYDWVEKIHKQMEKNRKERNSKIDLPINCSIFQDEVFAFTPKGKILDLNKDDTVLDFAFKLHTQVGNSAVSAEVNGKTTKLSSILKTGDIVEIRTDKSKKYQRTEALNYVNSLSSKFKIRKQLSKNRGK
jgi:GTP pyrophosphokinase